MPVLSTTPGSIVTLIRAYKFQNNGNVVATYSKVVKYQPPPAPVCESVPVSEIGFDGIARTTIRQECRTPFFIPEPPVIYDIQGTYQVTGNKITMSFPGAYSVRATISGNTMSGQITEGGSSEFWTISRKTAAGTSGSGKRNSYPNVERNSQGKLTPANGYEWVNPDDAKDFRVEPKPGLIESEPGKLRPARGYRWVNKNDPDDFRVERVPGTRSETHSSDLTGKWEGTYTCGQGVTNLTLVISQSNTSDISAIFKFSANRNNPSVPSGSFSMKGTYDDRTNKLVLKAANWIEQPAGYMTVDLVGKVSQGNTKISGEVINCSTFILEKQ